MEATHGDLHERFYGTSKIVAFYNICEYGSSWRPHSGASTSASTEALKWVAFFNICEYGGPWRPHTRGLAGMASTEALKWVDFHNICEYGGPWRPHTGLPRALLRDFEMGSLLKHLRIWRPVEATHGGFHDRFCGGFTGAR